MPIHLVLSWITTLTRFWAGWRGTPARVKPDQTLILYEFEGCPFCRIAREAVTGLQLSAEFRPCPKRGQRYRADLIRIGGKAQFPYLIDPNTGTQMYESADIARYLYRTYGQRAAPVSLSLGPLNAILASLSLLFRLQSGVYVQTRTKDITQPLILWGIEGSPRTRLVREQLCSLEIPYHLHTAERSDGQTLRLEDPNAGAIFETADSAIAHLNATYKQG